MRTSKLKLVLSIIAVSAVTMLRAGSAAATDGCPPPVTLHLVGDDLSATAPSGSVADFADSPPLSRSGGNPFREVGTWVGEVDGDSCGVVYSDLHLWLGLRNSDDQGTNFDLLITVLRVATGGRLVLSHFDFRCITGLTRNPALAREVSRLASFGGGESDTLPGIRMTVFARIADSCGGHNSATGLRLYFDSATRDSRFTVTPEEL